MAVTIINCSGLARFGLKGPEAATWLAAQNIALPSAPNTWASSKDGSLILRLGNSEYLVEDQANSGIAKDLLLATQPRIAGLYPVMRADAAFILQGDGVADLFSEICVLDLSESSQALYMTQVASISATILQQAWQGKPALRIWCDGTYHDYMQETLSSIAIEIGSLNLELI